MQRELDQYFQNKSFLITGGTGSFGHKVAERLLGYDVARVTIFSRDEKKQDDMRKRLGDKRLRFVVGDVRDRSAVDDALRASDYIFHAAAMKQVPTCEFFPLEACKTNVVGTSNVLKSAVQAGISKVIVLSTDKAVYPINAMGQSKALMEKVMVSEARVCSDLGLRTVLAGTRYGNVISSRGSVIPLFIDQIKREQPITITEPEMTRFLMSLDNAVDLVLKAFYDSENGDIHVQKSPAATVLTIAKALVRLLVGQREWPIEFIGSRHGEKFHETLVSAEEMSVAQDVGGFYRVPCDMRSRNYTSSASAHSSHPPYTSEITKRLSVEEVCDLFENTKEVRNML
tara:strand:+ start:2246 stop:3271 length:1026 start_codon:yes stop_codon:yes gene_type:complete